MAHVARITVAEVTGQPTKKGVLELRASGLTWRAVAQKLGKTEAATISRAGVLKARELRAKT